MPIAPDACSIRIAEMGIEFDRWTEYTVRTEFLTPADSFSFAVGDPDIPSGLVALIKPGLKVQVLVNDRPIVTGYLDDVDYSSDRSGGTVIQCTGRDVLGDVVDSTIDPYVRFSPEQSLTDVIQATLAPYGLTTVATDNVADRSIRASNQFGAPQSKVTVKGKAIKVYKGGGPTKRFLNFQAKPYPGEGVYEFLGRLCKRSGLHMWAKADGTGVVVGKPDFAQTPLYQLVRLKGKERAQINNVISGRVRHSRAEQPSIIVAGARGGGGDFSRSTLRALMVNELVALDESGNVVPSVQKVIDRFPKAYRITEKDFPDGKLPEARNPYPRSRPLFLMDQEANNLEQLVNFVKREMTSRQSRAMDASYTVQGHSQFGKTWAVDTMVSVSDDIADVHETMWIRGVTFHKTRSSGTTTTLDLIRPHTLRLS